uniref:TPR_REGION domain-containing protein n=1 Tax=Strongyloides papillosus TaxID=174720 RepID=A0A0N5BV12_STREA
MIEEIDDKEIEPLKDSKIAEKEETEVVDLSVDDEKNLLEERIKRENDMEDEELENLQAKALEEKKNGNIHFGEKRFSEALNNYQHCIEICPLKFTKDHSIFHGNISACYIKLENWESAINSIEEALKLDPNNLKFVERRAFARKNKKGESLELAIEDYKLLIEKSTDKNAKAGYALKIKEIENLIVERNEKLKNELFDGLKKFGDFCLKPFGLSTNNFELKQNDEGGYSINMKQ